MLSHILDMFNTETSLYSVSAFPFTCLFTYMKGTCTHIYTSILKISIDGRVNKMVDFDRGDQSLFHFLSHNRSTTLTTGLLL